MISPIIKRYKLLIKSVESRIDCIHCSPWHGKVDTGAFSLMSFPNSSTINTRRRRLCAEEGVLKDELATLHKGLGKFVKELNEAREC
jgi:hypothetical protein